MFPRIEPIYTVAVQNSHDSTCVWTDENDFGAIRWHDAWKKHRGGLDKQHQRLLLDLDYIVDCGEAAASGDVLTIYSVASSRRSSSETYFEDLKRDIAAASGMARRVLLLIVAFVRREKPT